jgi:type I restriction enzyme M protein
MMKALVDSAGIASPDAALGQAAGQAFHDTSPFSLRDLRHRTRAQRLKTDFETYLDGFLPNVQDVLEKFEFRNQGPWLAGADILGGIIEKFFDPAINLTPHAILFADGSVRLPALDKHGTGTIVEELIRRVNEELLDELRAELIALEQETEGLLHAILDAVPSGATIGNGAQG